MNLYSDETLQEMSKEAEAIGDLLRAISDLLDEEKVGSSVISIDNVIHVDFGIEREFHSIGKTPMKLPRILALYHDWAERTYMLVVKNRGRLQKGKLRDHVQTAHDIVATITRILPMSN